MKVRKIASERSVAWLRWEDREGCVGWGEIAPLPGRSRETLQEAIAQVKAEKQRILGASSLKTLMQGQSWFPSVAFALESAFLQRQDPWHHPFQVATSALLMGTKQEIEEQIPRIEGASIVKLKLAKLSLLEAKQLIETLSSSYILRIDANRVWSQADMLALVERIPLERVQYFEEPFCSWEDYGSSFPYPIAMDESLHESHLQNPTLLEPFLAKGVRWMIYKPSLLGGVSRGKNMFDWAKERGVRIIFGSSFESHVGIACIADLARRLESREVLGLGTLPFVSTFAQDHLRYSPPLLYISGQTQLENI